MTRKLINPNEASLAAAYFVPAYQRFRQWHRGQTIDLLCFVEKTTDVVKHFLDDVGAQASKEFRAKCFAEVWEMPHDVLLNSRLVSSPAELDARISDAIGSVGGTHSAKGGYMLWGDCHEEEFRRKHVRSGLVEASRARCTRTR